MVDYGSDEDSEEEDDVDEDDEEVEGEEELSHSTSTTDVTKAVNWTPTKGDIVTNQSNTSQEMTDDPTTVSNNKSSPVSNHCDDDEEKENNGDISAAEQELVGVGSAATNEGKISPNVITEEFSSDEKSSQAQEKESSIFVQKTLGSNHHEKSTNDSTTEKLEPEPQKGDLAPLAKDIGEEIGTGLITSHVAGANGDGVAHKGLATKDLGVLEDDCDEGDRPAAKRQKMCTTEQTMKGGGGAGDSPKAEQDSECSEV